MKSWVLLLPALARILLVLCDIARYVHPYSGSCLQVDGNVISRRQAIISLLEVNAAYFPVATGARDCTSV